LAAVLNRTIELKELGNRLFCEGILDKACLAWQDAALEIDIIQRGTSWRGLVKKGGEPFVNQLAELYFLLRLNIVHLVLPRMEAGEFNAHLLAKDSLEHAEISLKQRYWGTAIEWQPTDAQMAKLRYRAAVYARLTDDPNNIETALRTISQAMALAPNDPMLEKEQRNILAFRDRWTS
jgi:hypothetical protein